MAPAPALILVPLGGAVYAYLTMLYVYKARRLQGAARAQIVRRARWTALATATALLIVGLAL